MSICYVDTSVLAKRYFNEAGSDEAEAFLIDQTQVIITELTAVEMRSLIARRRRDGSIDAALEAQIYAAFRADVRRKFIREHALSSQVFQGAEQLIAQLPEVPLRTLDALHLAAAQELGVERLATADKRMRDAAERIELAVDFFGK